MSTYLQGVDFQPFSLELVGLLLILVVLLLISALLSGSEAAFFSLSPANLKELDESDTKDSKRVVELLEDKDRLLSTHLIGNNLVNIGAVLVANSIIDEIVYFGNATVLEFLVKIIVVTFLLLLFGEIMPKIFAAYNPPPFARKMSPIIQVLKYLFRPLSSLLIKASSAVTRTLAHKQSNLSISELTDAIEITKTESAEDKKILTGIVRFVGTEVDEIMKPRIDVVAMEFGAGFDAVKQTVVESGFSRLPVYSENLDTIRGILYVKDLVPHLEEGDEFAWQQLLRPAYFVPEQKKLDDLLEDFQKRKIHIAVVVDEYGGTLGIVSLEDILEEIVGEIADESDTDQASYHRIDDHTYLFEGRTHLGDFLRVLNLPDSFLESVRGDADTLAGLMIEMRGEFFNAEEYITFNGITFTATRVENRRIMQVRITLPTVKGPGTTSNDASA